MNTKPPLPKTDRKSHPLSGTLLAILTGLFFLPGILIFALYGLSFIPVRQTSGILPKQLVISSGTQSCTLEIPAGTLKLSHPEHAAVGSTYKTEAKVQLDQPFRFTDCSGGLPNWNINLEAQTTLVAAAVEPYASIRQPAFDRDSFTFRWTFTPEEPVRTYTSHFWLRVIISQQDETIERWDILVRDFPMENVTLFGQPTVFWLITGAFSILLGSLLLILLLQQRRTRKSKQGIV